MILASTKAATTIISTIIITVKIKIITERRKTLRTIKSAR